MANDSTVLSANEKDKVATVLEDDAQVVTNTQLNELLEGQPEATREEIVRINTDARPRSLQIALLIPLTAALIGLVTGFRMLKQPDPVNSGSAEGMMLG